MDTLNLNLLAREKARSELVSRLEMDRGRYEAVCLFLFQSICVVYGVGSQLRHKHKDFEKTWAEQKKQELRQIEDGLIKAQKEVERQAARMKEAVTTTPGSSDIENLKVCKLSLNCNDTDRYGILVDTEMLDVSY